MKKAVVLFTVFAFLVVVMGTFFVACSKDEPVVVPTPKPVPQIAPKPIKIQKAEKAGPPSKLGKKSSKPIKKAKGLGKK